MKRKEIDKRLCEIRNNLDEIEKVVSNYFFDKESRDNIQERFPGLIYIRIKVKLEETKKLANFQVYGDPVKKAKKHWSRRIAAYVMAGFFLLAGGLVGYYVSGEANVTLAPGNDATGAQHVCRCSPSPGRPLGTLLGVGVSATVLLSVGTALRVDL